jgi:hypothetical protein
MKKTKQEQPITKTWELGLQAVKEKRMDDARNCFDFGIAMVAHHSLEQNLRDKDLIESVKREVWLMRFWKLGLEKNNLLL